MFDSLVDFLKTNIDELNGHEVQISSEFKEHHNEDSKYIIKNWLFSSPEYRKWRITRLDGGKKLQVFNTVVYPNFDIELPVPLNWSSKETVSGLALCSIFLGVFHLFV